MTQEPLAWAVRPGNRSMQKAANDYLAAIQQSGELQALIDRSIPFYKNTAYSPKQ
jgi:polar amino acid transport system substrate-binding protein